MDEDFIECREVAGKQIEALRIYKDTGDGTELQIDFPAGTSFSCCFVVRPAIEASMIRPGVGPPRILKKYDLDCLLRLLASSGIPSRTTLRTRSHWT